ncbi:MAG: hypothetical protein QF364_03130 [Candidatus Poseidoniaceae archaeon]|jgi:hypothetical protein|nr:hypothetical protein [Candidatus Poseidoniaceae archaeon]
MTMTTVINRILDIMCWTAAAPMIHYLRKKQLHKETQEQRDIRRISRLLNTILLAHGDLLS